MHSSAIAIEHALIGSRMPHSTQDEDVARFVCAEIRGGNRVVDSDIELPGLRGHLFSQPCGGGRGGDVHYLTVCGSGLLSRMCLADVAGHGEKVAAVGGEMHRLLRSYIDIPDQRRFLRDLNRRLESADDPTMTTAVTVSFYPPNRRISVSYAGHPPAYFYRSADRAWSQLRPDPAVQRSAGISDLPLAIDARTTFTQRQMRVSEGDRLLLLTDGVLEAPSPAGELFGEQRLEALLREHRDEQPDAMVRAVLNALRAFTTDDTLRHDDVTVLLIEFTMPPRGWSLWHVLKNRLLRPLAGQRRYAT